MKGNTILILDDDPLIVELAQSELEDNGFRVLPCTDPRIALEAFDKESIDLALIDLVMPEIQGQDIIRKCKNMQKKCSFIVFSGYLSVEEYIELQSLEVVDCFHKPVDMGVIVRAVSKALIANAKVSI